MSRFLMTLGIVLFIAGLIWPVLQKVGLGRLPGDFVIERENFRLYLPLGTSVLISALVTAVLWWLNR